MKKRICLLCIVLLCVGLAGCFHRENLPKDCFFSEETLSQYALTGLPSPKLENARLKDTTLYCNLTMEEYEAYVAQVLSWLQSREDIYHLGTYCTTRLMAEFLPYKIYSFLPEDYSFREKSHHFAFSLTDTALEDALEAPVAVQIKRESGSLSASDFSYNTVISLARPIAARFDPCYHDHHYDSGIAYPIPGLGKSITIQSCIYCGSTTQDWYYGNNTSYAVKATGEKHRIAFTNYSDFWTIDSLYAGLKLEISLGNLVDGDIIVLVNGEEIPKIRDDGTYWTYGFIMPRCDVEVEIRVIGQ